MDQTQSNHAELTLRGYTLMLGPEIPQMGSRSAKTIGTSRRVCIADGESDKMVAKAVSSGRAQGTVMDMFWGDRCGPCRSRGLHWMVATHIAEPTPQEMKKRMKEQCQPAGRHSEWLLSGIIHGPPLSCSKPFQSGLDGTIGQNEGELRRQVDSIDTTNERHQTIFTLFSILQ